MSPLDSLLEVDAARYEVEGARLAEALLQRAALVVAGTPHRIAELELYFVGGAHRDPFAHAHDAQAEAGRWYFHRAGQSYRGGSFKGLDLTFGAGADTRGGALIRSLRRPDGSIICGPSLVVDALLAATEQPTVAALDAQLGGALDPRAAIHLTEVPASRASLLRTARVGLTLKRHTPGDERPRYLMRPDRWLGDARAITKGRVHAVVALAREGRAEEVIRYRTRSPKKSVAAWTAAYHGGRAAPDFARYAGRALKTADIATLQGMWDARFGGVPYDGRP